MFLFDVGQIFVLLLLIYHVPVNNLIRILINKMKCNVNELAHLSDQPCIMEGRLNYRKVSHGGGYLNQTVFKERWFRLVNNYLFYFKISEMGKFDTKNPAGAFVMENSSVDIEDRQSIPFAFSISFIDESDKRHMFAARSADNVAQWVTKLRICSYEYLRNQLYALQSKIFSITGSDPLLLVPRNEGAKLWAPSVPYSTAPACTSGVVSFNCHLHTNGFSLERSKSDVQAHRHLAKHHQKTKFYTDDDKDLVRKDGGFALGRSNTVVANNRLNPLDRSIFDNRPTHSRAAPSPPVRTRLSPSTRRAELSPDTKLFTEQSRNLAQTSILDPAPIPPKRKVSPRTMHLPNLNNVTTSISKEFPKTNDEEDLITF